MAIRTSVSGYPDCPIGAMAVVAIGRTFFMGNSTMKLRAGGIPHPHSPGRMPAGSAFVAAITGHSAGAAEIIIHIRPAMARFTPCNTGGLYLGHV